MFAALTIYGLYEYDSTVFDNMVIPADLTPQRDDLIMSILAECSDFSLLYPDFDFMKMLIGVWSRNELRIWEKMLESEEIEYNPIENYDRHETLTRSTQSQTGETDHRTGSSAGDVQTGSSASRSGTSNADTTGSSTHTGSSSTDSTGSNTHTGSSVTDSAGSNSKTGSSNSESSVTAGAQSTANGENVTGNGLTAFESDTIKNTARSVSTDNRSTDSSETRSGSERSSDLSAEQQKRLDNTSDMAADQQQRSDSTTDAAADQQTGTERQSVSTSELGSSREQRTGTTTDAGERQQNSTGVETVHNHVHGNIGVTTAAQMLAGFREISNFCTIDFIVNSFKDRFCIQVY